MNSLEKLEKNINYPALQMANQIISIQENLGDTFIKTSGLVEDMMSNSGLQNLKQGTSSLNNLGTNLGFLEQTSESINNIISNSGLQTLKLGTSSLYNLGTSLDFSKQTSESINNIISNSGLQTLNLMASKINFNNSLLFENNIFHEINLKEIGSFKFYLSGFNNKDIQNIVDVNKKLQIYYDKLNLYSACNGIVSQIKNFKNPIPARILLQNNRNVFNLGEYLKVYCELEKQIDNFTNEEIDKIIEKQIDWSYVNVENDSVSYQDDKGIEYKIPKIKVNKLMVVNLVFQLLINCCPLIDHAIFDKPVTNEIFCNQNIQSDKVYNNYSLNEERFNGIEESMSVGNDEIKPRVKPDYSSTITGILKPGRIVYILEKNDKWIHIKWTDENKIEYCGWIQDDELIPIK